ncbi:MAG: amidoligase family protein [Planctomycetota bacterium]|jgi:hypothetical protein
MTIAANEAYGVDYLARTYQDVCSDCGERTKCYDYEGRKLCADCLDDNDLFACASCGEITDYREKMETPDGEDWCEECFYDAYTTCERCGDHVASDDSITVTVRSGSYYSTGTEEWCESCADAKATRCDDCGEYSHDELCYNTAGGSSICDSCYSDGYFTCEDCNEVYSNDDMRHSADGCYCESCAPCEGDFDYCDFRNRSGCITEIGSARRYGIELETDSCDSYYELDGTAWGAKDDPTVCGKEFFSAPLDGDEGLQVVRDWANLADRNGWRAGSNAGYHLHLDLSYDSDDSRWAIFYAYCATQAAWWGWVDSRRHGATYSDYLCVTEGDIERLASHSSYPHCTNNGSRYGWANTAAWERHRTLEIRLHQGTCDGREVINWVKANTRFADWAATKGLAGVKEALDGKTCDEMIEIIEREAWQDKELSDFYAGKRVGYSNRGLDRYYR